MGSDLAYLSKIQPGYVKVLKGSGPHRAGDSFLLLFIQGPLPILWAGKITDFKPNLSFTDVQTFGPFKKWKHTHGFQSISKGTRLEDTIEYELWGGAFGRWLDKKWIRPMITRMFEKRIERVRRLPEFLVQ